MPGDGAAILCATKHEIFSAGLHGTGHERIAAQVTGHDGIHVAPDPGFAGLNGANERVTGGMEVPGSVLVLGRVTAAYVTAFKAEAQMDPAVSGLHAVFTDVLIGAGEADLGEMAAL
jgi:hypothetical protein